MQFLFLENLKLLLLLSNHNNYMKMTVSLVVVFMDQKLLHVDSRHCVYCICSLILSNKRMCKKIEILQIHCTYLKTKSKFLKK